MSLSPIYRVSMEWSVNAVLGLMWPLRSALYLVFLNTPGKGLTRKRSSSPIPASQQGWNNANVLTRCSGLLLP